MVPRWLESEIYMADRDGAHLRKLLGEKEKSFGNPHLSPDGIQLAYTISPINDVSIGQLLIRSIHKNTAPAIIRLSYRLDRRPRPPL